MISSWIFLNRQKNIAPHENLWVKMITNDVKKQSHRTRSKDLSSTRDLVKIKISGGNQQLS